MSNLAQLRALLARLEGAPQLPPGVMPPGGGGAGTAPPSSAQVRANIAKLESAIAKIDAGLGTAHDGLGKLSSASAQLSDARTQLRALRTLARISADASAVGVDVAEYQLSQVAVRSPADGVVVQILQVGDVVAPGATVAVVRRSGDARAETWLSPRDASRVRVGDRVTVSADWFAEGDSIDARVSRIGVRAEHPPTSFPTLDVHLTRAILVEIALPSEPGQPALPPGAPVDLVIEPGDRTDAP